MTSVSLLGTVTVWTVLLSGESMSDSDVESPDPIPIPDDIMSDSGVSVQ